MVSAGPSTLVREIVTPPSPSRVTGHMFLVVFIIGFWLMFAFASGFTIGKV